VLVLWVCMLYAVLCVCVCLVSLCTRHRN
jgi:hypothetical protein